MNCREFMDRMEEYLDGKPGSAGHDLAAAHLQSCTLCQQRIARVRALRAALRELPIPEPRPEFFDRALEHARQSHTAPRSRWPYAAGAALAASLALWLGFNWLPSALPSRADKLAGVTITLHEPRAIQLAFNAERSLQDATLSIRLPDGVELQGFPGQHEIRWRTDLTRGVNMLSLPLIAVSPSGGTLLARLEHGERATEIAVPLRVSARSRRGALRGGCVSTDDCQLGFKEVTNARV